MKFKIRRFLLYVLIISLALLNFLDAFHSGKHHAVLHHAEVGCHQFPAFEKIAEPDNDCPVCLIQSSLFTFLTLTVLNFTFLISGFYPVLPNITIYNFSFLSPSNRAPPFRFVL